MPKLSNGNTRRLPPKALPRFDQLTYRGNLRSTRHGWLRLTPAYSLHLVRELLQSEPLGDGRVLDPFCGTGTTALLCSELGIQADTTDINPFLCWLARAKTRAYSAAELQRFHLLSATVGRRMMSRSRAAVWVPALHQIEKWWQPDVLLALGRAAGALRELEKSEPEPVIDLLKLAFCQALIARANVSFGHQSMSFQKTNEAADASDGPALVASTWRDVTATLAAGAASQIAVAPAIVHADARELEQVFSAERYQCVVTSPPYPNRMSYIRELRPYMYWLGYLSDGRAAGALDWQAIGGTWGSATSRLGKWSPPDGVQIPFRGFSTMLARIHEQSPVLSRYVHKYFHDMLQHSRGLFSVVAPGGRIHYVVGNSKFYDVLVPVERIYAALFVSAGFEAVKVRVIRKRSSKKELFEFVVSAEKPRRPRGRSASNRAGHRLPS